LVGKIHRMDTKDQPISIYSDMYIYSYAHLYLYLYGVSKGFLRGL